MSIFSHQVRGCIRIHFFGRHVNHFSFACNDGGAIRTAKVLLGKCNCGVFIPCDFVTFLHELLESLDSFGADVVTTNPAFGIKGSSSSLLNVLVIEVFYLAELSFAGFDVLVLGGLS